MQNTFYPNQRLTQTEHLLLFNITMSNGNGSIKLARFLHLVVLLHGNEDILVGRWKAGLILNIRVKAFWTCSSTTADKIGVFWLAQPPSTPPLNNSSSYARTKWDECKFTDLLQTVSQHNKGNAARKYYSCTKYFHFVTC